ncbi:MAG: hypothetical protein NVSMB23_14400 [Myxococcales bacterium]
MARVHRATALLAVACALAPACKRAGQGSARLAEALLPAQPPGAASTAPLGQLADHASDLVARVSRLPGGEQVGETRKALALQLGFDPLTRDGLSTAGLDPARGAALSLAPAGPGAPGFVAVLPLRDEGAFVAAFEKLARERGGYAARAEEKRQGTRAVVFSRPDGVGKLGYAIVRGYAVVARTGDPAADLAAAAARTETESLAGDARFAAMRAELGATDLLVYAPAQGWLQGRLLRGATLPGDAALGLAGGGQGLHVRAVLALPAPDAHEVAGLLVGGGEPLSALLPKDAPVQLRLGLAPAQLPAQLARVPRLRDRLEELRRALAERKVDLDRDLFGALQAGAVAALSLSPRADLSRAVDGGAFDLRRSPFDLVQVVAFARPSDEARLRAALEAVSAVLPRFGATAARTAPDAFEWQVTYPGGEGARFGIRAVDGAPLAYLAGGTTLDEVLARKGAQGAAGPEAVAALVDLGGLAAQVSALPPSAYGKGPQSYVARSIVSQLIEPLRPLRMHGTLAAGPRGVVADVVLDIARPDGTP